MRRDPTGCAQGRTLGKLRPHLRDVPVGRKRRPKWPHTARLQCFQLLPAQRDQIILFVHDGQRL